MGKRLIVLTVLIVSGFAGLTIASGTLTGSGTAGDPYLINNLTDFQAFCANTNYWAEGVHTRLENDIDLTSMGTYTKAPIAGGNVYYPFDGTEFSGVFDGNDHVIRNLTVDGAYYCGLFGKTSDDSFIKNLGVENVSVSCSGVFSGGVVGDNDGNITSSYSTGQVAGYYTVVGGLAGANGGIIISCYSTASVSGSSKYVGGLVGRNSFGIIANCYSSGPVASSNRYVGGLAGNNRGGNISCCYSTGSVSGSSLVGGLVGSNSYYSTTTNCYSTGSVKASDGIVGGLAGGNDSDSAIANCYSTGSVESSGSDVGGLVGVVGPTSFTFGFWCIDTSGINDPESGMTDTDGMIGKSIAEMQDADTFLNGGWDFINESSNGTHERWQMPDGGGYPVLSSFSGYTPVALSGDGSENSPYLISNAEDMGAVFYYDKSAYYKLIADIDLTGIQWTTAIIPVFNGNLDGDGFVISNMSISGSGDLGLFGKLEQNAVVKDLGLEDISVVGVYRTVGGLAGGNSGCIENAYVTGTVTSERNSVGGLVAYSSGSITNSYATVDVSGTSSVGGLVGSNRGIITGCHSDGSVFGSGAVGGLAGGTTYGSIINSYSSCSVSGSSSPVGGLVGFSDVEGIVSSCYSTGSVSGLREVGGLTGEFHGIITNSYSTGSVIGEDRVGGLVGTVGCEITNCYSTGSVSGLTNTGGLVGYEYHSSITGSFWDIETSGMTTSIGGIGKTTLQMQDKNTFVSAGWDFVGETANGTNETWQMPDGGGYPVFSFFNGYIPVALSGDGTESSPYLISNAAQLGAVQHYDISAYYKLTSDIDLTGIQWTTAIIPTFNGYFDGNGFAIRNMSISGGSYLGLIGRLEQDAVIENVGLENISVTGVFSVGGLVGCNDAGFITSSYSNGSVSGNNRVGGLVGFNDNRSSITNCYSTGSAFGKYSVGGLVGLNRHSITSSYSTSLVAGEEGFGGLVGWNYRGSITGSYSTGLISGSGDYVGGLVGRNYQGSVASSFWDVETSGMATSDGGIGKTTLQMQAISTFLNAGWDFDNVWYMLPDDYPRLVGLSISELVGLEISGPNEVAGGCSGQFTATAYYDNDAIRNVTNSISWSVDPADHCSISQSGVFVTDTVDSPVNVTVYAEFTEGGVTVVAEKAVLVEAYIAPTGKMFWSEYGANRIMCSNFDGSQVEVVISVGLNGPLELILDIVGGKMYWASWGDNVIRRANFDGSQMDDLVSANGPVDVALEAKSGKMYWTEYSGNKIARANLDGSDVETLITDLGDPRGLTLDLIDEKIYWGDSSDHSISRANLDGTGIETIISSELLYPAGLEIDVANGKIYWSDYIQDNIKRANLDGSEAEDIVTTGLNEPLSLSLDTANGKMYWVDKSTGKLYSANLDGTDVVVIHSDLDGPYGITIAPESVPPVADAGLDMVLSADGECGALVILDGSGSSDEGGNELTYRWYYDGELFDEGVQVEASLGLDTYLFTLIVNNGTNDSEPNDVVISVVDDTRPGFTVSVDRDTLWPVNHKMVEVTPSFNISDNCGGEVTKELVSITCNQESEGDIEVTDGVIFLRAERDAGEKDGRVYTIIYKATDGAGNEATASTEVKVPHNLGRQNRGA